MKSYDVSEKFYKMFFSSERTLSLAYLLESEYYIEKHRYEEALVLLNNVNPEYIDTDKFTVEMYKREIINTINSINRKKDIEAIKTMTSNICEMNYFDKFHASDYKNDMLKEVGIFKEHKKPEVDDDSKHQHGFVGFLLH